MFFCFKLGRSLVAIGYSKCNEWQRIDHYSLKKGSTNRWFYILCSILSIILLLLPTSCQSNKQEASPFNLSLEERDWMTQFFEDVMLSENGIYTLWGSIKPITLIVIELYTDTEKQAFYDSLTDEEKKECFSCVGYSLDKTWFKWEKIQDRFPMNRYMLFKADRLQEDHAMFILFIDILKTAAVIQDNYEAFRTVVGADFHPLELTLNMRQKDSDFLDKLIGNAHLWGILFGYGNMNSYLFHWQHFDHPKSCDEFCKGIASFASNDPIQGNFKFTISQFEIPGFKSFNEIDPIAENYKKEREKIKEIYKGKDFLDVTLKKLIE